MLAGTLALVAQGVPELVKVLQDLLKSGKRNWKFLLLRLRKEDLKNMVTNCHLHLEMQLMSSLRFLLQKEIPILINIRMVYMKM